MAKAQNNQSLEIEEKNNSAKKKSSIDKTKSLEKELPTVRDFYNQDKKQKGESFVISKIQEIYSSKSKQFYIILECEEFKAISHRGNTKGKKLFDELLPATQDKIANALTMTINPNAKDGYELGIDRDTQKHYELETQEISRDGKDFELETYKLLEPEEASPEKKQENELENLTVEALLDTSNTES